MPSNPPISAIGHIEARHIKAGLVYAAGCLATRIEQNENFPVGNTFSNMPPSRRAHSARTDPGDLEAVQTVQVVPDGVLVPAGAVGVVPFRSSAPVPSHWKCHGTGSTRTSPLRF